jgi:PBP1b-binding outer membrane lipoprotein LpoB
MRIVIGLFLSALLVVGCSGKSETELTEKEKEQFRGTKPPDEVLKKLQEGTPAEGKPAGPPTQ